MINFNLYSKISNSKKFAELNFIIFIIIFLGIIGSIFMFAYLDNAKKIALKSAKMQQATKLESVSKKIEIFSVQAMQTSRFIKENISGKKLSKNEIEERLKEFLKATPSETIYGIGIWWNPYAFNKEQKFFGPYIHRDNNGYKLTYEWQTPEYNYPTQHWFLKGLNENGQPIFIEPYFDTGLVYVTLSQSFKDRDGKDTGVISVDMILPQLQSIIDSMSEDSATQIYITTKDGALLAHPQKDDILKSSKEKMTLLDYNIDQVDKILRIDRANLISSSTEIPLLKWKIIISNSKSNELSDFYSIKTTIQIAFIVLWIILFSLVYFFCIYYQQKIIHDQSIENTQAQLAQSAKMAALGEMAAGIAHEINNPLTIIIGKTSKLLKNLDSNENGENVHHSQLKLDIEKIKSTVNRIAKIVNSLKTFSRASENDQFRNENIETIINDALELSSDRINSEEIILSVSQIPEIILECRAAQLVQVLLNLIVNSCDAITALEKKWINIEVRLNNENKCEIKIIDSGKILDKTIIEKMMLPFFSTKDIGKGTGLGLSISQNIMQAHNGSLTLDTSAENTTFIMTLPLKHS